MGWPYSAASSLDVANIREMDKLSQRKFGQQQLCASSLVALASRAATFSLPYRFAG
jgi:hypothetical protein